MFVNHTFALRKNIYLLYPQPEEIHRKCMDPKCVLALIFVNAFKLEILQN